MWNLGLLATLLFLLPNAAAATWSIVAVDVATGEVGSAGASCTGFVAGIVGVVPGHGVIVAQARSNGNAREEGVRMLRSGADPETIIAAVANSTFDPNFEEQQYGVAALGSSRKSASFTGASTHAWQGHELADGVAMQGNILTGPEVVSATLEAFQRNRSVPLAERLLLALEAGASAGGDNRCGEQRALSSYLVVSRPDDAEASYYLTIVVPGQRPGGRNAVQVLRERYDRRHAMTDGGERFVSRGAHETAGAVWAGTGGWQVACPTVGAYEILARPMKSEAAEEAASSQPSEPQQAPAQDEETRLLHDEPLRA